MSLPRNPSYQQQNNLNLNQICPSKVNHYKKSRSKTHMKLLLVISLFHAFTNTFAQKNTFEQINSNSTFLEKIIALQNGEISNLSLGFMDSIKIKPIIGEKIDDRDSDRHKSGFIKADQLKKISALSICEVTDNYIVLVVEDKFKQLRGLTVSPVGKPIESILICDNLIYLTKDWYEYEARRYSPTRPYHYDPVSHEFTFSTIFKIREPRYEEVLIDFKDHEDETTNRRKIKINEEGFFNEPTYEYINSNLIELADLTLKSAFFMENSGKSISNESYQNSDDKFRIYLDIDQSIDILNNTLSAHDHVVRIIPNSKGKIEVYQRLTFGFSINGDGDNCELQDWTFSSNWDKLVMKNDLVSLKKYSDDEKKITPKISVKDLKRKIKTECGDYHLSLVNHISRLEDVHQLIQPREVILKVQFTNEADETINTEYVIFVIANSC